MTFIALATYGQRAEIVTDTSCYPSEAQELWRTSKVHTLPHLDAALILQGDNEFGGLVIANAHLWSIHAVDFDDFAEALPRLARQVREDVARDLGETALFLVGYSPSRGRFLAYGFPAEDDWIPFEIKGAFVHPSPLTLRPSDMELERMAVVCHPTDVETLRTRPKPTKPATREEWLALALASREQCALAPRWSGFKVTVMGALWHTTLTRGGVHMDRIHEFDDSGEEFQRLVSGTLHPQSQLGPCECGSGQRYLDCHMVEKMGKPCPCKSGKALRDCCAVTANDQASA